MIGTSRPPRDDALTEPSFNPAFPALLSVTGGYVDTAGFLALQGLFAAHVTGNFVTFAASLVFGVSGAVAKLMALPVFCLVVVAARLVARRFGADAAAGLRVLLAAELALLSLAALLAVALGPFPDGDTMPALATGMVLVAAMAIQNAVNRIDLPNWPATTVITGNMTQFMLDAADLLAGVPAERRKEVADRFKRLALGIGAFGLGGAGAALCYAGFGPRCFVVPPVLAAAALVLRLLRPRRAGTR
jgi:uncharacterized membrane protein YoaK (UPF0700 family)